MHLYRYEANQQQVGLIDSYNIPPYIYIIYTLVADIQIWIVSIIFFYSDLLCFSFIFFKKKKKSL